MVNLANKQKPPATRFSSHWRSSLLIAASFGLLLTMAVVLTGAGLARMAEIHRHLDAVVHIHNAKNALLEKMYQIARERPLVLFVLAAKEDPFERDAEYLRFKNQVGAFLQTSNQFQARLNPQETADMEQLWQLIWPASVLMEQVADLLIAEQDVQARTLLIETVIPAQDRVLTQITAMRAKQTQHAHQELAEAVQAYQDARITMLALCSALLLLGSAIAGYVVLRIHRQGMMIQQSQDALQRSHDELEARVLQRTAELAEARDQAVEISRLQSTFLASMSHEIRTPMNGVLGIAELLLDTDLGTEQRQYAEVIHRSGSSLLRIINEILDFSKIEAGKLELEYSDFEIRREIEEVLALLRQQAQSKKLALHTTLSAQIPAILRGDPLRLRQILTNLVGNAIKFTHEGKVSVRAELDAASSDEIWLAFTITDSGIGIAEEALPLIFEPFSQADGSTTRQFGGTGLGLPIAQALVEKMGGRLTVTSTLGQGTQFRFRIGLQAAHQASLSAKQETVPPTDFVPLTGRILVAEDDAINRVVAGRMLDYLGCEHLTAKDGTEALAMLTSDHFDAVLMDWHMPGLDGLQVTRQFRATEKKGEHTPIIGLTASTLEVERARCLEAGMDEHLGKPFTRQQLYKILAAHLPVVSDTLATQQDGSPAIMDKAVLERLRTLENADGSLILPEIIELYLANVPKLQQQLQAALRQEDHEQLFRLAHSLKNNHANVGATELAELALTLESLGRKQSLQGALALLQKLEEKYPAVAAELEQYNC